MAVSSAALNLAQYAQMSNDPLVRVIVWSLLGDGGILADVPLVTRRSIKAAGVRFVGDSLPTPTWTPLNVDAAAVNAVPTPFEEQLFIIRNAIEVDRYLVEDEAQIQDPRAVLLEAYLRAVRYDFCDKFINNNQLTGDPHCFTGLRARLDDPARFGCETELKIDAGAVDLSPSGMTATTANSFIELVDTLLDFLGASSGEGVTLYMNEVLKRRFQRALRTMGPTGGLDQTRDQFDRMVERYRGATIRVAGRKKDQTSQVITSTETSTGADGASVHTSLYGVRYGGADGMYGWQFRDLQDGVRDAGLTEGGAVYRTTIDWGVGLYVPSTRAIGRIYGIKLA